MTNSDAAYLQRGDKVMYNNEIWKVSHIRVLPSYVVSVKIRRGNEVIYGVSADMIEVMEFSATKTE